MKVLFEKPVVLGSRGMLGRCVVTELQRRGVEAVALSHADLDLADLDAIRRVLMPLKPSIIFNCAAFTRVDDCETQVEHAMRVNGHAPGVLADIARQAGGLLVHVSSDYIFKGVGPDPYREDDPTGPDDVLSAYGRSKLEGDRRILASGCRHLIARTSWVYGIGGPNFVDTIEKAARVKPELKVVNDQRGRPTYAADLCEGIFALLDRCAEGVFNVSNGGECTWYEFAIEILKQVGLTTPVVPCTTSEYQRPAKRPAYSVLDLSKYHSAVGRHLRTWDAALRDYFSKRAKLAGP